MKTNRNNWLMAITIIMGLNIFSNVFAQEKSKDSLSYYLEVAIENNPSLKAKEYAHNAYLEKIQQARALQDPELTIAAYTPPMDILGGRMIGNVGIMQMFPWFGIRKAAQKEAVHQSNIQKQEYREELDNLILEVSTQWYLMQKLNEQLSNNEENKVLLEQLEGLATRKYSSSTNGSGGMSDVLRIQMEIVEIDNNIESLQAQLRAEKAKFNALLNQEVTEQISIGENIEKLNFIFDESAVLSAIEANNPTLARINEESLTHKAKAELERKKSYPMLGIGLEYMLIGKTNNSMFSMGDMNGRDMLMPMVSVSLPIFRKKYNSQQNEIKFWQKSSEAQKINTLNLLKSEYHALKSKLKDAERVISLYEKQIKLAETTYDLIVNEFIAGKSDLTNVIQVQRQLLDYQFKKTEAISNYNIIVVNISKLMSDNR